MPYTHITSTGNGAASLQYAFNGGKGHNGNAVRNQMVSGINLIDDKAVPYERQMSVYWNRASRCRVQTFRVVQSFSREELDPDKPEDIQKAHEIGRRSAAALFPDHQAAVFTQTDGESGLIHNHIIVSNINMKTYKAFKNSDVHYKRIEIETDNIAREYVHPPEYESPEPDGERVNRTVKAKREKNQRLIAEGKEPEYIWQDDLRERIARAADASSGYEEMERLLAADGVGMTMHKPKNPEKSERPDGWITYELKDTSRFTGKVPKNLRSKSYKLGWNYNLGSLEKTFERNREAERQAAGKTADTAPEPEAKVDENAVPGYSAREGSDGLAGGQSGKRTGLQGQNGTRWVTYEEAQKQAEELLGSLYSEKHSGKSADGIWNDFKRWRVRRRKQDGRIDSIYDKSKTTGLVTLLRENLEDQFRRYDAERMKEQEERRAALMERQIRLDSSPLSGVAEKKNGKQDDDEYDYG